MSGQPFYSEMLRRAQNIEHCRKLIDPYAQPTHSRVDLQVHGMLRHSKSSRCLVQRLDL